MHIGDHIYPVYLGYNKLPQLVEELRKLDFDKVRARGGEGRTRARRSRAAACALARARVSEGVRTRLLPVRAQ